MALCKMILSIKALRITRVSIITHSMLSVTMSVIMLRFITLSVFMLCVNMQSAIMLSVIMLSVTMLRAIMLSGILLCVIMLSAVAPLHLVLTIPKNNWKVCFFLQKCSYTVSNSVCLWQNFSALSND